MSRSNERAAARRVADIISLAVWCLLVWVLLTWTEDLSPAEMERRGRAALGPPA